MLTAARNMRISPIGGDLGIATLEPDRGLRTPESWLQQPDSEIRDWLWGGDSEIPHPSRDGG